MQSYVHGMHVYDAGHQGVDQATGESAGFKLGAISARDSEEPAGSREKGHDERDDVQGEGGSVGTAERASGCQCNRSCASGGEPCKVGGLLDQARQVAAAQSAQTAAKQQASQTLRTVISEGDRLASVLLAASRSTTAPGPRRSPSSACSPSGAGGRRRWRRKSRRPPVPPTRRFPGRAVSRGALRRAPLFLCPGADDGLQSDPRSVAILRGPS
jgi:hypothetical protein